MKPAVSARASQDGLVMRRPLDLGIEHSSTWVFHKIPVIFLTWKISSLCDSKLCSLSLRFLRSQRATVLSALPVAKMNSE